MASSTVGSSTMTGWKRRSRAASFSMYLRYSSSVVAPMHWSSPRESGGLRMLAASMAPSAAPAPTSVWSSSMKRTLSWELRSSSMIFLSRSSNSPRYFVPGDERADVEGQDALVDQGLGHVAGNDPLRERLGDGGLADSGLPDERGVVLRLAAEDLDDALDLLLSTDDRVEGAGASRIGEVDAELVERWRLGRALRLLRRSGAARLAQDVDDLVADLVEVDPQALEHPRRDALALAHEAEEEMLGADVVVAQAARLVDGELDDPLRPGGQADLSDDRAVAASDDELDRGPDLGQLDVHVLEHARRDALALADEAEEEMLGPDVVVVEALRLVLGEGQHLPRSIGELVESIHDLPASQGRVCPKV